MLAKLLDSCVAGSHSGEQVWARNAMTVVQPGSSEAAETPLFCLLILIAGFKGFFRWRSYERPGCPGSRPSSRNRGGPTAAHRHEVDCSDAADPRDPPRHLRN